MYYQNKLQEKQLQNSNNFKTATTKQIIKLQLPHSNYKTNYKPAYAHLCTTKKKTTKPHYKQITRRQLPNSNYKINYKTAYAHLYTTKKQI